MKPVKIKMNVDVLFVFVQIIFYAIFLILDLSGEYLLLSRNVKFCAILLCFCYALFQEKSADRSILFCMKAGLFFTLLSDLFLLILDCYLYGVLTFIIVQQLYGIRILLADFEVEKKRRELLLHKLPIRIILQLMIAVFICLILKLAGVYPDFLLSISIFYFICISTNTITAVRSAILGSNSNGMVLFAVGMCLFLLCDINVGLFNMSGFITLPEKIGKIIYNISSILMWTFYAPSQVLISLSIKHNLQKNKKFSCKNM